MAFPLAVGVQVPMNNFPPSDDQWNKLMNVLICDKEMRTGFFEGPNGKIRLEKKWSDLASELNKLSNARKSGDKWKEAWDGLKTRAKRALHSRRQYMSGTGGGVEPDLANMGLSLVHQRALELIGTTSIYGKTSVPDPLEVQLQPAQRQQPPVLRQQYTQQQPLTVQQQFPHQQPLTVQQQYTYQQPPAQQQQFTQLQQPPALQQQQQLPHQQPPALQQQYTQPQQNLVHSPPFTSSPYSRKRLSFNSQVGSSSSSLERISDAVAGMGLQSPAGALSVEAIQLINATISSAVDCIEDFKDEMKLKSATQQSSMEQFQATVQKLTDQLCACKEEMKSMEEARNATLSALHSSIDQLTYELRRSKLSRLEECVASFSNSVSTLAKL